MKAFKIGGACKWLDEDGQNVAEANFVTTTVRKLLTLTPKKRHEWMWPIVEYNLMALRRQLEFVAALPPRRRMWRISSELLPVYTHAATKKF
jgi:UV DNA damage repair endonuclease